MFKNVSGQKLYVFAFDATTNLPKTGDAANITAYVAKDYGSPAALTDTSASEVDSTNAKGYYVLDLTQGETNADTLLFSGKSSTSNVVVIGAPATVFTRVSNPSTLDAAGVRSAVGLGSANLDTQLLALAGYIDTEVAAILAAVDTEVAAIKAKTDNLPSDPADASDIAASFSTVNGKLDAIDDFVDTEVAAIKAKTDNLPASPAAVGSAMTLTSGERDSIAATVLKLDWSGITGEAARCLLNAARFLRNKWFIDEDGVLHVTKENDTADAWTAQTATTAGDPVSSVDPN